MHPFGIQYPAAGENIPAIHATGIANLVWKRHDLSMLLHAQYASIRIYGYKSFCTNFSFCAATATNALVTGAHSYFNIYSDNRPAAQSIISIRKQTSAKMRLL